MSPSSTSKTTLLVSLFSGLTMSSSATPIPHSLSTSQSPNCRCIILSDSIPHRTSPAPIIHTYRRSSTECASLAPQLEFWRQSDPQLWPEILRDLQSRHEGLAELDDLKVDATRHARIVCIPETPESERWHRKVKEEGREEWKASWGTVLLGVGVVGVVIGVVAEGVEMLLFRSDLFRKRKQPISLDGSEKYLLAFEDDSSVTVSVESNESEKAYFSDDDRPVI